MKNVKTFSELNESETSNMKLKFVADVTDKLTNRILKDIWTKLTEEEKKKLLKKIGHSEKYIDSKYEDLTGEIKSKIITKYDEININDYK